MVHRGLRAGGRGRRHEVALHVHLCRGLVLWRGHAVHGGGGHPGVGHGGVVVEGGGRRGIAGHGRAGRVSSTE